MGMAGGKGSPNDLTCDGWLKLKDQVWQQTAANSLRSWPVSGPADWPRILLWEVRDRMSNETLSEAIRDVWTQVSDGLVDLPGVPLRQYQGRTPDRLTTAEWGELFRRVGYLSYEGEDKGDAIECEQPTTLYRYAEHGGQIGWSWTVSVDAAAAFEVDYDHELRSGCVWKVTDVDPSRLLAHFHTTPLPGDDTENEYVYVPVRSEISHVKAVRDCPLLASTVTEQG